MADQKKQASTNGEFKTAPLGFDKAEVMAYIVQHNKERKALKEENDELKKAIEDLKNDAQKPDINEELEKKKADLDAQILESRKQILDERRKLAQTEKELHVLQDKYQSVTEEYAAYKKQTSAKLQKAKNSGGTINPEQLAEISAKANADANAVIEDAQNKANEIITAAKAYFADTVQKTYDYKQSVLDKADAFADTVTSGGITSGANVDVSALLSVIKNSIDEAVAAALGDATAKISESVSTAVSDAKAKIIESVDTAINDADNSVATGTEEPSDLPEQKLSDDEELNAAKAELENIGGFNESELDGYTPLQVEPYAFVLKLDMPSGSEEGSDDFEDDEILSENNGLLSTFEAVASDDDISAETSGSDDLLVEDVPVAENTSADDFSDLIEEEPVVASAPTATSEPTADDFSDLLAEEPAAAPAPTAKAEEPAADDFSDLLAEEPAETPAPVAKAEEPAADDFSDLLAEEPAEAPAAKAEEPAADDFSDLLSEEPVATPAPASEAPAADDFSDLLADTPSNSDGRNNERGEKPKEKLNESRAMGVAGKETPENDPWKELEAQMNGMTIAPPPARPAATNDEDDEMTSSFDDNVVAPAASEKEEKIDMSEYSSMLGGLNDNMNTNNAQYDPSWDLKMMEGLNDDDDDEMSSDNVGFFDL